MIKIEVTAEILPARSDISAANQVCYAYFFTRDGQPQPHPTRVLVPIWTKDGQKPYAVGMYTLAPASFFADKYAGLAVAPKLLPLAAGRGGA